MRRDSRSKQGGKKRVGRGVKSKRLPLLSAKREGGKKMGEQSFFIKVIFSYTTMSRKNFRTRKSEYNYN